MIIIFDCLSLVFSDSSFIFGLAARKGSVVQSSFKLIKKNLDKLCSAVILLFLNFIFFFKLFFGPGFYMSSDIYRSHIDFF